MKKIQFLGLITTLLVCIFSCSKERTILEKGAGFYQITKKQVIRFDSARINIVSDSSVSNFGTMVFFAKSGGSSSSNISFKGQTLTYYPDTVFSGAWEVGPTDENRMVLAGKVYTLEGWGKKKVTLTRFHTPTVREVFHLERN